MRCTIIHNWQWLWNRQDGSAVLRLRNDGSVAAKQQNSSNNITISKHSNYLSTRPHTQHTSNHQRIQLACMC